MSTLGMVAGRGESWLDRAITASFYSNNYNRNNPNDVDPWSFILCVGVTIVSALAVVWCYNAKGRQTTARSTTSTTTKSMSNNNNNNNHKKKEIFTCPYSQETTFVQESAPHLPLSPMDLYADWTDHLATRWLVAGISGQDKPNMLRAGLTKLRDGQHFIMPDRNVTKFVSDLNIKQRNLDDPLRRDQVFVMEADSVAAQRETLDLFMAYLPQQYPHLYTYNAQDHSITVHPLNTTFSLNDQRWKDRPLELCERILQEDLVLMRPGPPQQDEDYPTNTTKQLALKYNQEGYYMAAAAVQFSFQFLPEKLGQPVEFIHAPVPGYQEHIRKTMNLMFSKLQADQPPLWRTTWDIHPTGQMDHVKAKYQREDYTSVDQLRHSGSLHLKVCLLYTSPSPRD